MHKIFFKGDILIEFIPKLETIHKFLEPRILTEQPIIISIVDKSFNKNINRLIPWIINQKSIFF